MPVTEFHLFTSIITCVLFCNHVIQWKTCRCTELFIIIQGNKHSESIAKAIQVPNRSHQIQTCNHFMEPVWNQFWIHNSVKKGSAIPNFEIELDLIVFKLYTKLQLNIYNGPKENERKPFLICIFLSPRGITPSKSAWQYLS